MYEPQADHERIVQETLRMGRKTLASFLQHEVNMGECLLEVLLDGVHELHVRLHPDIEVNHRKTDYHRGGSKLFVAGLYGWNFCL